MMGRWDVQPPGCGADGLSVIATTSAIVPGLLGTVLIALSAVAYKWVSLTVGGHFFDRCAN